MTSSSKMVAVFAALSENGKSSLTIISQSFSLWLRRQPQINAISH